MSEAQSEGIEGRKKGYLRCIANSAVRDEIEKKLNSVRDETKLYLLTFAPALIAFVVWTLEKAVDSGKTRLYFLSRDGYQMHLIAKAIVERNEYPIECKYLKVSRYSMRVPGYHLNMDGCIDEICVGGVDVTVEKIIRRSGISESQCQEVINSLGYKETKDQILNYHQVLSLRERLNSCLLLKRYIYMNSINAYQDAVGYLNQEGLMRDDKYAVVDSGWVGTLQCSIEKLVQSVRPDINVEGYYFGMYDVPKSADMKRFHAFLFGKNFGLKRKMFFSNSLFETIVSSEEGMTVGYGHSADGYYAVENVTVNPNVKVLSDNVDALTQLIKSIGDFSNWGKITKTEISKLFERFMSRPTDVEVNAYGDSRFSDDVIDGCFKKVAADLPYEQIRDQWLFRKLLIVLGIHKKTIYESSWLEGSTVKCGKNVKRCLRHIRLYKLLIFGRKQLIG